MPLKTLVAACLTLCLAAAGISSVGVLSVGQLSVGVRAAQAAGPAVAPAAKQRLRAAFLFLETIDDQGWTTSHHDGIEYLKRQLGDQVEVSYTENVHTQAEAERVLRVYASQGYDVIFGTTFSYMEAMDTVAGEYPTVVFMHCSGYKTRPNLGTYMVRIEQGEYLAGYLAGLMGYRNVGTVATQPIPEVLRGIDAFTLGLVRGLKESGIAFDPGRVNTVVWLNSWRDAVHETALAVALAAKEHDLIRQMADTPETSRAACQKGVAAMGYGTDSAKYGAACALTSTTFQWGPLYVDILKKIMAGTWRSEQMFVGFEAGGVELSPFGPAVPQAVAAKVLALEAKMARGEDMSFAGPIFDQAGALRVKKGQKATDAELLSLRWLVKGVVGQVSE